MTAIVSATAPRLPRSLGSGGSDKLVGLICFPEEFVFGGLAGFIMSCVEVVGLFLARTVALQCFCLVVMRFPAAVRLGLCDPAACACDHLAWLPSAGVS